MNVHTHTSEADDRPNDTTDQAVRWRTMVYPISDIIKLRRQRLKQAIRRDVFFLLAGAAAYFIVAYVETHADDDEIRLNGVMKSLSDNGTTSSCAVDEVPHHECIVQQSSTSPKGGIIDAGFILTKPIHSYLERNHQMNDLLAFANCRFSTVVGIVCVVEECFSCSLTCTSFYISNLVPRTHFICGLCHDLVGRL